MLFLSGQSIGDAIAEKLASPHLQGSIVAAQVQTLDGRILFERNSELRVMPASNQKILSVGYAMAKLGPEFRARTRFWREKGKVFIDAPGNPMVTYEQLKQARAKVGTSPVVYVRQAYRPGIPSGWELDDLPNRYAAPVTALTLEQGAFELWGGSGKLYFKPESFGAKAQHLGGSTRKIVYDPFTRIARVYGPIPKEATRLDTLALKDPDQTVARFFGGNMSTVKDVPSRAPDFEALAPILPEVAKFCMVKSDNNIAEHLMLLAASTEGPLGADAYKTANERMKKFWTEEAGCPAGDLRPLDGSGMSRHNFATARSLARAMTWATNRWGEAWTGTLATPGNGTLIRRLEKSTFRGKTGTLDAACSLTGLVNTADGQKLVISLVFNHYTSTSDQVRGVQDEIVRILEKASIGTILEGFHHREVAFPFPSFTVIHGHRLDRSCHDGCFTCPRENR